MDEQLARLRVRSNLDQFVDIMPGSAHSKSTNGLARDSLRKSFEHLSKQASDFTADLVTFPSIPVHEPGDQMGSLPLMSSFGVCRALARTRMDEATFKTTGTPTYLLMHHRFLMVELSTYTPNRCMRRQCGCLINSEMDMSDGVLSCSRVPNPRTTRGVEDQGSKRPIGS
eukprot:996178-Rhodomonas_salina.1